MHTPKNVSESVRRLNPEIYGGEVIAHVPRTAKNEVEGVAIPVTNATVGASDTRQFTNLVMQPSTDESKLNKLERDWLRQLRLTHPAENIGIQSITLKLGDDCRYSPDFWTIDPNGQLVMWECKGFMREDALVKLKVAARLFRHFRFVLVTRTKGQWEETPVRP